MEDKKVEKEYRTYQFLIKKGNPLNDYFINMMHLSNNLYNATNFHIRQIYTGLQCEPDKRHKLQNEVIELFKTTIPLINKNNEEKYEKLIQEDILKGKDPSKRKLTVFKMPDEENKFVNYNLLDAVFKTSKNKDYTSLPAHVNQGVMKNVYDNWSSFFKGLARYKVTPSEFTGRPKPPRYKCKGAASGLYFSNQVCKIKEEKDGKMFLRFPKTKLVFNLSKHLTEKVEKNYKLMQVRVQKFYTDVKLEVILECTEHIKPLVADDEVKNILALDLGVNNLVAGISTNAYPLIINGKPLKSINQWYNKQRAYLYSSLRINKKPDEGVFTTYALQMLDKKRALRIKDYLHKASKIIVEYAKENNIHKVIVGLNKGWKDNLDYMKKGVKQTFKSIPFSMFLNILEYKLKAEGIRFKTVEESYTSKASFLDKDELPTYTEGNSIKYQFSGKRVKRGLYVTKEGITINADINGACNILRKYLKKDIELDYKVLSNPVKINISRAKKSSKKIHKKSIKKQQYITKMKAKRTLQSPSGIVDRTANCVAGQSGLVCTSMLI